VQPILPAIEPQPTASRARLPAPAPAPAQAAPLDAGPQPKTGSMSSSSGLHPLNPWSLRQTRGGSGPPWCRARSCRPA
jgi:hypothetical protein